MINMTQHTGPFGLILLILLALAIGYIVAEYPDFFVLLMAILGTFAIVFAFGGMLVGLSTLFF